MNSFNLFPKKEGINYRADSLGLVIIEVLTSLLKHVNKNQVLLSVDVVQPVYRFRSTLQSIARSFN